MKMMSRKIYHVFFCISVLTVSEALLAGQFKHKPYRDLRSFEIAVTAADQGGRSAINTINGTELNGDLCDNRWAGTWGTTPDDDGGGTSNPHPGTEAGATWIKFEFNKVC